MRKFILTVVLGAIIGACMGALIGVVLMLIMGGDPITILISTTVSGAITLTMISVTDN